MSNLFQASHQWATRPADERYSSLEDMLSACQHYRHSARTAESAMNKLTMKDSGGELYIQGQSGTEARMTHWAFGQICTRVKAPAEYLRRLPAPLAAQNINEGLQHDPGQAKLLVHKNGDLVLRCITSDQYGRIWNDDVIKRMIDFKDYGWRVPPARPVSHAQPGTRIATEADVLEVNGSSGLSIKVGDLIAPAGLYASDHDCFVFMVNEQNRIKDGTEQGLSRGFFLSNSEVGAAALKVTSFMYRHVCGNHIVWGAENARTMKIVHRGEADSRFHRELVAELEAYCHESATKDEETVQQARSYRLGVNKEEVLNTLFKVLRGDLAKKTIEAGYDEAVRNAETDLTMDPNTVWGTVQGLTSYSRDCEFADERNKIDQAAGKVLSMVF